MRVLIVFLSIILIASIAWTIISFQRDLSAARARIATGKIVQTRCGPIEYVSVGSGAPILVVHGAGGGFDQGLDLASDLVSGFHVIAMSRFGYLGTPLPQDASAAAQAD